MLSSYVVQRVCHLFYPIQVQLDVTESETCHRQITKLHSHASIIVDGCNCVGYIFHSDNFIVFLPSGGKESSCDIGSGNKEAKEGLGCVFWDAAP